MGNGNRILYQFFCDNCMEPYEIMMTLAELDDYEGGDDDIECPRCEEPLRKLMCPVDFRI